MNDVLLLKGRFEQKSRPQGTPIRQLPSKAAVHGVLASHINDLIFQLKDVKAFWKDNTLIQNILIDVHYDRVIAKSNRVQSLFEKDCSDCIVGARFSPNSPKKHIITYCFARNSIDHAIDTLKKLILKTLPDLVSSLALLIVTILKNLQLEEFLLM